LENELKSTFSLQAPVWLYIDGCLLLEWFQATGSVFDKKKILKKHAVIDKEPDNMGARLK
jgi:hypothetical protein